MRALFLACFAALLLGCGPGGNVSPEIAVGDPLSPDVAAPAQIDRSPVIVCFGDSLTSGFNIIPGNSYPEFLQEILKENGYDYLVFNEGISGDTTSAALIRTEIVTTRNPRFVVIALGANDGLRGLSTERMHANLRKIIQRFQRSGVKVILAGVRLPPNYGSEYIGDFERTYVDVAAEMKVPFLRFLLEGVADNPRMMQAADRLHPTEEGNRVVAQNVFRFLAPLLKEDQAEIEGQREKSPDSAPSSD